MLVRQSEPETALDILKQALSELNQEKNILEGMPHYKHRLNDQTLRPSTVTNETSESQTLHNQASESRGRTSDPS